MPLRIRRRVFGLFDRSNLPAETGVPGWFCWALRSLLGLSVSGMQASFRQLPAGSGSSGSPSKSFHSRHAATAAHSRESLYSNAHNLTSELEISTGLRTPLQNPLSSFSAAT